MNTTLDKISHKAQRAAASVIIDKVLAMVDKDREKGFLELVDWAEQFWGNGFSKEDYDKVRTAIKDPDNRWIKFINRVLDETNPHVAKMAALNLGFEAFFRGTKMIRKNREIYHCNIPWLILFDPTSACNMHCQGCWSGTYGHKANLSFDDMDKIITEGKELGVYLYMMTGGEPLVRKADILRLAEKHNDVELSIYTNSTLIDEDFCKEVVRLGNITFQLSIEGTPETNDARRGEGHYAAVMKAMDLLKKYGIIFGTSICYTRANIEAVTSDEFLRMIADKGARFGFYFHYMPVGNNAVLDLMPTMEQREYMIKRIREIRSPQCDIGFFPMDFQNDGEYVGGCIAGGRNYFHINSAGDAEPPQVTQNLVYSSISPTQTFMRIPSLRCCRVRCLRHTMKDSRLTETICVHARCLRTLSSFRRWFMKQALIRQTWNHQKQLNISAISVKHMRTNGRAMQI